MWLRRLANTFRTRTLTGDIDREIAFHVAERAEELRRDGVGEDEAGAARVSSSATRSCSGNGRATWTSRSGSTRCCATSGMRAAGSRARQGSRLRHPDPGRRDRRQHRRLLGDRRGPASPAPLSGSRSARAAHAGHRRARRNEYVGGAPDRLESPQLDVRRHQPLHVRGGVGYDGRDSAAGPALDGGVAFSRRRGYSADARPRIHGGRASLRRSGCRADQRALLAEPVRRRSPRPRARHPHGQPSLHHHRRAAARLRLPQRWRGLVGAAIRERAMGHGSGKPLLRSGTPAARRVAAAGAGRPRERAGTPRATVSGHGSGRGAARHTTQGRLRRRRPPLVVGAVWIGLPAAPDRVHEHRRAAAHAGGAAAAGSGDSSGARKLAPRRRDAAADRVHRAGRRGGRRRHGAESGDGGRAQGARADVPPPRHGGGQRTRVVCTWPWSPPPWWPSPAWCPRFAARGCTRFAPARTRRSPLGSRCIGGSSASRSRSR